MEIMFNLKSHSGIDEVELLRKELKVFEIFRNADGYTISIGDESLQHKSLADCLPSIDQGINELKENSWHSWLDLAEISRKIATQRGTNTGSIDNLLFLNAVKSALALSRRFTELLEIRNYLKQVLDSDIQSVDNHLIKHFNADYIRVKCLHKLIISEIYRKQVIWRYMKLTKQAQISGPWANLDLPIKERMWEWDSEETEFFKEREQAKKDQIRYNPENQGSTGFYFVWNEPASRQPYKYEDREKDSVYKSRHLMNIP